MGLLLTLHPWKVRLGLTPAVYPGVWNLCIDRQDARSGKYAGGRRPLKVHSVRRGNGQECQHCLNAHAVNHQYKHLYT